MGNPERIARRLAHGPGYAPKPPDSASSPGPDPTALLVKIRSALRSGYTTHAIAYEFGDEIDALLGGPDESGPLSQSVVMREDLRPYERAGGSPLESA